MDFTEALNIIRRDLDEARAQLEKLSEVPGTHIAEVELARSRVRSASELLAVLPRLLAAESKPVNIAETPGHVAPAPVKNEQRPSEPATVSPEKTDRHSRPSVADVLPEPAPEPAPEPVIEPVIEVAPAVEAKPASVTEARQPAPPVEESRHKPAEPARPILADKFPTADRLGEKITQPRKDEAITTMLNSKPVSDIGAAIGINDRFYFIRELFNGDARAYNDTIGRLNRASSLGEAMKILDESTVMGTDPGAQSSFVDVVRRKFRIDV